MNGKSETTTEPQQRGYSEDGRHFTFHDGRVSSAYQNKDEDMEGALVAFIRKHDRLFAKLGASQRDIERVANRAFALLAEWNIDPVRAPEEKVEKAVKAALGAPATYERFMNCLKERLFETFEKNALAAGVE